LRSWRQDSLILIWGIDSSLTVTSNRLGLLDHHFGADPGRAVLGVDVPPAWLEGGDDFDGILDLIHRAAELPRDLGSLFWRRSSRW